MSVLPAFRQDIEYLKTVVMQFTHGSQNSIATGDCFLGHDKNVMPGGADLRGASPFVSFNQ